MLPFGYRCLLFTDILPWIIDDIDENKTSLDLRFNQLVS